MDVVILAAGRNDRLKGVVPSYMKPLIVVNGRTLITSIIDATHSCERVVVVASPENVKPLVDVVTPIRPDTRFVVQPEATGPLHALELGLELVTGRDVTIVCADNVIPPNHWDALWHRVSLRDSEMLVSVRDLPGDEVERFTYFIGGNVYEKQPAPDTGSRYMAWIGPLVTKADTLRDKLEEGGNMRALSDLIAMYEGQERVYVEGYCADIGIPGELP